jgi:hypothetical protein
MWDMFQSQILAVVSRLAIQVKLDHKQRQIDLTVAYPNLNRYHEDLTRFCFPATQPDDLQFICSNHLFN